MTHKSISLRSGHCESRVASKWPKCRRNETNFQNRKTCVYGFNYCVEGVFSMSSRFWKRLLPQLFELWKSMKPISVYGAVNVSYRHMRTNLIAWWQTVQTYALPMRHFICLLRFWKENYVSVYWFHRHYEWWCCSSLTYYKMHRLTGLVWFWFEVWYNTHF